MKKLKHLQECINMCKSIGHIPASYIDSMSYQEQLNWFCKFLVDTVIPAVNDNNDAVEELQGLYIQLKNYVDNYFNDLDIQEEINKKLDDMAIDGSLYEIIRQYTDPIVEIQTQQITAIQSKINQVEREVAIATSGSPAGVYATLSDLQSADPDHSRIYVVQADGEWYFWNSQTNQWKNGGVYQATEILDESVTKEKTTFFVENPKNLYNKDTVLINKFISSSNGNVYEPTGTGVYYASDYIEVDKTKGVLIHSANYNQYAFYDENKSYISGASPNGSLNITIPSNAKYLRITVTNTPEFYLNYGGYLYEEEHLILNENDTKQINSHSIGRIKNPDSIVDSTHVMVGYYYVSDGNLNRIIDTSGAYYGQTDFIPVQYGETLYSDKQFSFVSEFDENFQILSWKTTTQDTYTPTNQNCKYISVLLLTRNKELSFSKTSKPSTHIPNYIPEIEDNSITKNMLANEVIEDIYKNNKYAKILNKKITFLGDSITWGYNGANPGTRVEHPFPLRIQELTGCVQTNLGHNGSTISGTGEQESGEYHKGFQPMNIRISQVNTNQDYLIVMGGTNDYGSGESIKTLGTINDTTNLTFYGSLDIICKYYYNNFLTHGMKIAFVTPIKRVNGMTLQNTAGHTLTDYVNAIKEVCAKYSIPVLDLYNAGTIYPDNTTFKNAFLPDGLHPNQALYNNIAEKVADFIISL